LIFSVTMGQPHDAAPAAKRQGPVMGLLVEEEGV